MTLLRALLARWARLVAGIGGGLAALLAATQARRWLAMDREWTALETRRLVGDGVASLAVVLVVAATLAAVETAVRLRRDGVLATLCTSTRACRRLALVVVAVAAATGVALVAAAAVAARFVAAPVALARVEGGWNWQPWPGVAPTLLAGAPGAAASAATAGAEANWLLAGCAGAFAVAGAFAFGALADARGRLVPHLIALDGLAVAAALWLAAPSSAAVALAGAAVVSWRLLAARGARRPA